MIAIIGAMEQEVEALRRKGVSMSKIIRCPRCKETLFFLCVGGSLPT